MTYEIISATESYEGPIVQVKIINADFANVMINYEKRSNKYIMNNLYSNKIEKENLEKICLQILAKEIDVASKNEARVESVINIEMVENNVQRYDINIENELVNAITGNLFLKPTE